MEQSVLQWLIQNHKVNRGPDQGMKEALVKLEREVIVLQNKTVNQLNPFKSLELSRDRNIKTEPFLQMKSFILEEDTLSKKTENTAFHCENCHQQIEPLTNGSFRNHCPFCLFSKHLDNQPGDRLSHCKGLMKPIQLDYSSKKGYQLVHKCLRCGKIQRNKVAVNTVQEDDILHFLTAHNQH